ncbi:hypothetical protein IWZ01DRAFT_329295 [Phyllosticta capitalensis]
MAHQRISSSFRPLSLAHTHAKRSRNSKHQHYNQQHSPRRLSYRVVLPRYIVCRRRASERADSSLSWSRAGSSFILVSSQEGSTGFEIGLSLSALTAISWSRKMSWRLGTRGRWYRGLEKRGTEELAAKCVRAYAMSALGGVREGVCWIYRTGERDGWVLVVWS